MTDARDAENRTGDKVVVPDQVDLDNYRDMRRRIDAVLDETDGDLVIDMSETEFLDSTGLGELVRASRRCREEERAVVVLGAQPELVRLLELTGLAQVMEIRPRQ